MGWLKNLFRIGTLEDKDGEQTRRIGRSSASLWNDITHPWRNWNPGDDSRVRDGLTVTMEVTAAVILTYSVCVFSDNVAGIVARLPITALFLALMFLMAFAVVNVCIRLLGDYRYFRENDELPHGENLDYDKLSDESAGNRSSDGVENKNN